MATLSSETVDEDGLDATYTSATAGGDAFVNDGKIVLHLKNTSGSAITVTVTAQTTTLNSPGMGSTTKANSSVSVPATTGERFLGPFPRTAFNDANGLAQITYSAATNLTVAVLKVDSSSSN